MKNTVSVTGKLQTEYFEKLTKFLEENPNLNKSTVIAMAVENFLNGVSTDNSEEIINLEGLLNEVKEKYEIQQKENRRLEGLIPDEDIVTGLNNEIGKLKQENLDLKNAEQTSVLAENQVIVTIPPSLKPFLDEIVILETRRVSKTVTIDQMLLQLMWHQIRYGAGDHLPRSYSNSQIKQILEKVKTELANE